MPKKLQGTTITQVLIVCAEWHLKSTKLLHIRIVDKIEKYGCDPKQLHHILRLKDFIERYCNGESYRTILIPKNKDMLLDIKSNYHYELEYSKNLAKETCEWIKQYKQEYMENNPLEINTEAKDVMEKVMTNLITFSIKNEVCRNE